MNKKLIIKHLKEKGLYDPMYDKLITELLFNYTTVGKAKTALRDQGLLVPGSKDGSIMIKNQMLTVYDNCLKNILNISKKLGMSAFDLKALGKQGGETEDGFDFD